MSTQAKPRALIVGAGVGGLAAALALEHGGWQVTVLERAAELRELGFALLLAPNAMRALRFLGVAARIAERAEVGSEGELRAADGALLTRISLDAIRRETGEDTVCALREVLHGTLLDALRTTEIRTCAHVLGVEQSAGAVEVTLDGGERVRGELLIGADGLRSKVRALLHGPDPLRDSGLVGHRGVCRASSWRVTGGQYFGRGVEAGVARAGGDAVYWYVSATRQAAHGKLEPKAAVLETLRGFEPALIDVIEHTEPENIRRDVLVDRKPLRSWSRGRVSLLGDAAHPMLPHAGQGAAQALEDAVVLGRCLSGTRDVAAALQRYERIRLPRANRVVAIARRNSRAAGLENEWLCAMRNWLLAHATVVEKQLLSLARVDLEV
ncbi:MAG: FAD-dependent monooxygenase [Polyangiales bacterium]